MQMKKPNTLFGFLLGCRVMRVGFGVMRGIGEEA